MDHILARNERERTANSGVFLWGIGNAIGPSIHELLRVEPDPTVIFSAIKSPPRPRDVHPTAVAAWTVGETLSGNQFCLPKYSIVTSRFDPASPKAVHYALVCFSQQKITNQLCQEDVGFSELRNVIRGTVVGASQVTAVVRRHHNAAEGLSVARYRVAIRAQLVYPYFVRLRHPVLLPPDLNVNTSDCAWIDTALRFVRERSSCLNVKQSPAQVPLAF